MNNSRSKNAKLNIIVGYVVQILILLLAFIGRKIFISILSEDYLGINGLYSNILSILAIADLGLGNVIQFYLYKPVHEGNYKRVNILVNYFKKLYIKIAVILLVLGLGIIPFLSYIVNADLPKVELIVYYIVFLLNSVCTYFAAHKIALLAANQDNRIQKIITLSTSFISQVFHIIVLILWKNYLIYVVVTLISTIINVITINTICNKKYKYLKEKYKEENIDKSGIKENVKSTFLYKIGGVIINNTDNILISTIVSTAAVGLYSNYLLIVAAIQELIGIITTSLISAVGNLSAEGNKERMKKIFNMMMLIYNLIAIFCAISFYMLFDDLIVFWIGQEFVLNKTVLFAISLNFYLETAVSPIFIYRETNGLFKKVKYLLLSTAIINIILSIILGKRFGVFGILISTSLARILTQIWYEPKILFKNLFNSNAIEYWKKQAKYIAISLLVILACFLATFKLPHNFIFMIIRGGIYLGMSVIIFYITCHKTDEIKELKRILKIKNK